jgi:hypothetical protein
MMRAARTSPDATAFRVLAALERYQSALGMLTGGNASTSALQDLGNAFRALRVECASLPVVNVRWAALLISHYEFLNLLAPWTQALTEAAMMQAQAQVETHQTHIDALAQACRVLMRGRRSTWGTRTHRFGTAA